MTWPSTHPRLWFNQDRLATAKAWYKQHPFTPRHDDYLGMALKGLLANDASQCNAAISWALNTSNSIRTSGVACDECRWSGEDIILTYDWCYNLMSASQRSSFLTSLNKWIPHWSTEDWGGIGMYQNNYYWGYLRNNLEWAVTSYEVNESVASKLLNNVFVERLADDFNPSATNGPSVGGIGLEGSQYGPYIEYYATVPFQTAYMYGNDVFSSTDYWMGVVYSNIYSTMPALTTNKNGNKGWEVTPFGETETWNNGNSARSSIVGGYMVTAAMRWPNSNLAGYARQWLAMTGAGAPKHIEAVDPGGPVRALSHLPLDYYAAGPSFLWGHSSWNQPASAFFIQMNSPITGNIVGHGHLDRGTWQLWRNGRWLSRETPEYAITITGYGGSGKVDIGNPVAHNSLLVNGSGPNSRGSTPAKRLESQPSYTYAVVDLSNQYGSSVKHAEREFVFVRSLETMVILDRLETSSASAKKTFLAHCEKTWVANSAQKATCANGDQALQMTVLLPANPTFHVVQETTSSNNVGQSRLEVDTAPGTSQSYILTVLQGKDALAPSLSPTVVDNGATYTVNLNASVKIIFNKGMSSTGGSISINGTSTNFRTSVQKMNITENGPEWQ